MKVIILSLMTAGALCEASLPLDMAMTRQELEQTGCNRLSPQQKQAFERWLEKWTRKVVEQAPSYHPSASLKEWIDRWPEHVKTEQKDVDTAAKSRHEANQRIYQNNNGRTLELHDGSVWIVREIDVKIATKWKRDEPIAVSTTQRDIRRPYVLTNTARNEEVGATLARSAHPSGERPADPPSHYQGSLAITTIDPQGLSISTEDDKQWRIAPADQKQVQADWRVKDRVKIQRSKDALYRYSINNLDSGDTVLANPQ